MQIYTVHFTTRALYSHCSSKASSCIDSARKNKCKYTSYIVLHSLYLHCCIHSEGKIEIYIVHFSTIPVFELLS